MSIPNKVLLLIVTISLLVATALLPTAAASFSDDFNRADSSTIGNGWTVSASGNGGPYGSGPDSIYASAAIAAGQVVMNRNGWGDEMSVGISHAFDAATSVQADLSYALVAGGVNAELQAYAASGAWVLVRSWDDSTNGPCIGVALSSDGAWHDWTTYGQPFSGYTGTATYQISTDGVGNITVNVTSGGTTLWSRGFTMSNASAFTSGEIYADWTAWTNNTTVYADNFLTIDPYQSLSIAAAKNAAEGSLVKLSGVTVSAQFYTDGPALESCAVQTADRGSGIRIVSASAVNPGDIVDVKGSVATVNGERVINAVSVVVDSTGNPAPSPLAASGKSTGGGVFGLQGAVADDATASTPIMNAGLNNVGLLMRLCGVVTASSDTGNYSGFFYVDDGSAIKDGSGNTGIMCRPPANTDGSAAPLPLVGDYVTVSGVMGVRQLNGINTRFLRTSGNVKSIHSNAAVTMTGPGGTDCSALINGINSAGVVVTAGTYNIQRTATDQLVSINFYITAQSAGSITVTCDDVMPLTLSYPAGAGWCNLRLPYSTANHIAVSWSAPGATWNEVVLATRSALPAWANPTTITATVSLSGVGTTATCDISAAFMTNWFEQGLVDGLTGSSRTEMIQRFHDFGAASLRYPGGTMTYGYPLTSASVPAWKTAFGVSTNSGLIGSYGLGYNPVPYASPQQYFQFCKDAGITAWFELNPGYWYDAGSNLVRKTISMDLLNDGYSGNYVTQATSTAAFLARTAASVGVDVVWEIGNEDYCYYTASTYALLCNALINGVRAINPSARVSVCGDSYSWSDPSWHNQLEPALYSQGVRNITYSSEHYYMTGVGDTVNGVWTPRLWDTPQEIGDSSSTAWANMRSSFISRVTDFTTTGLGPTKMAVTECNVVSGSWYSATHTPDIEHSTGRALGEAQTICAMHADGASIFYHDLVRSDPTSTFFARLDYYPGNAVGKQLFWYPEGAAVAIVNDHGNGQIFYNNGNGISVSNHVGYIYITAVNRTSNCHNIAVNLNNASLNRSKMMDISSFRASSANACFFDYYTASQQQAAPATGQQVTFQSPPYSVVGVKVYTQ